MTFMRDTVNPDVLPTEHALRQAVPVLSWLVRDSDFLGSHVLPLLEEAGRTNDWYVAYRHDEPEHSYSLQIFVWPPGSATRIHDHSCLGAFCCVVGSVVETDGTTFPPATTSATGRMIDKSSV